MLEKFLDILGKYLKCADTSDITQISEVSAHFSYTLLKFNTISKDQLLAASQFHDPEGEVHLFKASRDINDTLDLLVPPSRLQYVEDFGKQNNLTLRTKKDHYGRQLEDLPSENASRKTSLRDFSLFSYHSFKEINEHLEQLAALHPNVLQLETMGNSYEGRHIKVASISSRRNAGNPTIFVDAGIHAREWVAPALAVYMINRLVSDSNSNETHEALNGVDWLILPVVNPDGYEFSRSSADNRYWRKTRSVIGSCYGVDGNRNYDYFWGRSGSSYIPETEIYCGPRPFSERETQIVRYVMMDNKGIKLYVSLHSYGQYLVYPWGYQAKSLPHNWEKLHALANSVSKTVERAGGKPFKVMTGGNWYPASGASDDYAYGVAKIPYSYTMELTEDYEFTFPAHLLSVALPQFFEGFKTFASEIKREFHN